MQNFSVDSLNLNPALLAALSQTASALNKAQVCWALGGSFMLAARGLPCTIGDIDLIVREDDAEKAAALLGTFCTAAPIKSKAPFTTAHFFKLNCGGVGIDVMGGFGIDTPLGNFKYHFGERGEELQTLNIAGQCVPLCPLEDWWLLYGLMPGREEKVKMISTFFTARGMPVPPLFDGEEAARFARAVFEGQIW